MVHALLQTTSANVIGVRYLPEVIFISHLHSIGPKHCKTLRVRQDETGGREGGRGSQIGTQGSRGAAIMQA